METPSRHSFNLDGSLRVFPIPSAIKGDNYCRLEVDNVIVNDRAKYDIVNNSIVFISVADVPAGSVLDVLVVQSEEAIGQLAITSNMDLVATSINNVNIVGSNITNVNTVAGNTTNINTVAGNDADITTVAGISGNVTTVAGNTTNVNTVAGNTTNVNIVAGNTTNINTVAGINADVTTVAGISANVTSVVANETNINTVAADGTDIGLVAGSIASVNTTATNIASVNTNAANIADINTNATNIVDIQNAEENAASALASKNAAAISETNSETSNVASEVARAASVVAKNAAETAETNAATSETNAATSETNAATSETNAAASEATATTGATTATDQAVIATNQAVAAAASAASITDEEANSAASAAASASSATDSANSAASAAAALDNFDDRYLGPKSSEPTLDNDGDALVGGALYFATTSNAMQVYDGANWIAASAAGVASMNLYEYTATAGQTTFTGADDNNNSISFIQGNEIVVFNGIILDPSDYNSTTGTSIVLNVAAALNDLINVYAFKSFTVADTVSASTGGTFGGDVTVTGTLAATTLTGDGSAITGLPAGYTNTDVATYLAGTSPTVGGLTTTADVSFGDNDKAIFGAGADLQIYHDGSNSRILDSGTGDLSLEGANIRLRSTNGDVYAYFSSNAEAELYYNNAAKLATTATGIDVTGTAVADGLTVDHNTALYQVDKTLSSYSSQNGVYLNGNGYGWLSIAGDGTQRTHIRVHGQNSSSGENIMFNVAGVEASRIDASGNLLVGKLSLEYESTAGHIFRKDGLQSSIRSGGNVADFNRLANDGEIIRLSQDGSTVGSIGVSAGGRVNIASNSGVSGSGLLLETSSVQPTDRLGGASDNTKDLGTSSYRFKDGHFSGTVNAANFNTTSDATLKTNVETLTGSLDAVKSLRGVSYDWIESGGSEVGVIAQEVEAVLPDVVSTNDQGIKSVKYGNMVAVLIEAIKEQQLRIEALEAQLNS